VSEIMALLGALRPLWQLAAKACGMTMRHIRLAALLPLACVGALLAACSEGEAEVLVAEDHSDPLMSAALEEQIMVDPDMVNRNGANQVAAVPDGIGAIPRPDSGSDAAMAARAEAEELVGGAAAMRRAPPPQRVDGALPPEAALSAAARAATSGAAQRNCAAGAQFSARWAAQMPSAFPVYPRGNVLEAAGNDADGCSLRVVNFATAASVADVMDFYYTRARAAGYTVQHVVQGGDNVLGGSGRGGSVMVFARAVDGGLTTVDLVTSAR
jgi:hypothetical protein